ncbi:2-phospho-L-lactate guanylyltransferase [Novosphingobium resinovorum]|nr:2-phospho-L-lactate guanylyltransferase [Novosphingobium resinovorum]
MQRWTALVAMKQGSQVKSRLSNLLDLPARTSLAQAMARRVVTSLRAVKGIEDVRLLAPTPVLTGMTTWMRDRGAGLNEELARACAALPDRPLLVIHADLPFLSPEDVEEILAEAFDTGVAIAPDRHGEGTNALALAKGGARRFAFGPGSLGHHLGFWPQAAIVRRRGLAFDLDTPDDFAEARHCASALVSG